MNCLSIRQPWADCVVPNQILLDTWTHDIALPKRWENRKKWHYRYRGPLLIHASRTYDHYGIKCTSIGHVYGCIIGKVDLVSVRAPGDNLPPDTWYQVGMWGLRLEAPVRFKEPISWLGQLGLFQVPESILPQEAFTAPEY
jgi:hypothetical protein